LILVSCSINWALLQRWIKVLLHTHMCLLALAYCTLKGASSMGEILGDDVVHASYYTFCVTFIVVLGYSHYNNVVVMNCYFCGGT